MLSKPNYPDNENDDGCDSYIDIDHNCPHYYLLYPPLAVRTDGQRRTQLIILKGLIRNIAINFNERFERLRQEKNQCILQIEERNIRIKDIMQELKLDVEGIETPILDNREDPSNVLYVHDNEVQAEKYESTLEIDQRQRVEEEKKKEQKNQKQTMVQSVR